MLWPNSNNCWHYTDTTMIKFYADNLWDEHFFVILIIQGKVKRHHQPGILSSSAKRLVPLGF